MKSKLFKPFLDHQGFVLLDGALATELEACGYDINHPLWSAKILLEKPEAIKKLHYDYLRAGANCIITSSYQATFEALEKEGFSQKEAKEVFDRSIALAIAARNEFLGAHPNSLKPLVAASIGPYGAYLNDGSEYCGDYSLNEDELFDFHEKRFLTLADSQADLLAFETIPCLKEAKAYARLLEKRPNRCAWISFSCKDGSHLSNGEPIKEAASFFKSQKQVLALGVNCTPPKFISPLIQEIKNNFSKEIIVYPNSGEIWDSMRRQWNAPSSGCKPSKFANLALGWFQEGARLIGGCCRTGPRTIRHLYFILLPEAS